MGVTTLSHRSSGGATARAKGQTAYCVDDLEDLVTFLNAKTRKEQDMLSNICIRQMGVPDFWIDDVKETSVTYTYVSDAQLIADVNAASQQTGHGLQIGYYSILPWEGAKMDLSDYMRDSAVSLTLPATLADNTEYRLGNKSSLALALPASGKYGIKVVFTAGSAFLPTCSPTPKGADLPTTASGKTYEFLFTYNGANWVLNWQSYE